MASSNPTHRRIIAEIAVHTRWASVQSQEERTAALAPARAGRRKKLEQQADPEGKLSPAELEAAVERLRKAHFRRMALRSAQSRAGQRKTA